MGRARAHHGLVRHERALHLHICWGAQAGIYHHYGIPKYELENKLFGVFDHEVVKRRRRWCAGSTTRSERRTRVTPRCALPSDRRPHPDLELIAVSDEAGVYIAKSTDSRHFFVFGHPEYDADTLMAEYERDIAKGLDMPLPRHYFPNDDPTQAPRVTWRAHAQLLYTNWLNYYVYQTTPYDLAKVGTEEDSVHE